MNSPLFSRSASVSSSSSSTNPNGNTLGGTIEEKTRRILGWTEHSVPSMSMPLIPNPSSQRKADRARKSRSSSLLTSAPYPYSLLSNEPNKNRKSSCPTLTNMNTECPSLKQQLTPPPSPNQNGVTIVSMPRPESSPSMMPPPLMSHNVNCLYPPPKYPSEPASDCYTSLPISPVSPTTPPGQFDQKKCSNRMLPTGEVFEQLRKEVPQLSNKQSKFRLIVQKTIANVIEMETKMAYLQEETSRLTNILNSRNVDARSMLISPVMSSPKAVSSSCLASSPTATSCSPSAAAMNLPATCQSAPSNIYRQRLSGSSANQVIDQYRPGNLETVLDMPDDLRGIDVTAFKSMMCSPQDLHCMSHFGSKSKMDELSNQSNGNYFDFNYDCEIFSHANYNGYDPLLVDTSY